MSTVQLDIMFSESRSRLTTFLRAILAIPHQILSNLLLRVGHLLAVFQWFIVLFTGKRNHALFNLQSQWLAYGASTMTYQGLMYDRFPPFVRMNGHPAMTYGLDYNAEANRLTNFLRLIRAIPALIIGTVLTLFGAVLTVVSWFVIIITGRHPRALFDPKLKIHRDVTRLNAYLVLLTDEYPKFD